MEKEFVPYAESLALKELGFDEPCFGYFTGDLMHLVIKPAMSRVNEPESYVVTAPLFQQSFRWFRENYNKVSSVHSDLHDDMKTWIWFYEIEGVIGRSEPYKSYEEAELACLRKLIELAKSNENSLNK